MEWPHKVSPFSTMINFFQAHVNCYGERPWNIQNWLDDTGQANGWQPEHILHSMMQQCISDHHYWLCRPCDIIQHDGVMTWKHFLNYWSLWGGYTVHQSPVDSPQKGPVMWCFDVFLDVGFTCSWTKSWDAGDSRCHSTHMVLLYWSQKSCSLWIQITTCCPRLTTHQLKNNSHHRTSCWAKITLYLSWTCTFQGLISISINPLWPSDALWRRQHVV